MRITYINTTFSDYPDDESLAVIVYFSGCSHECKGCHNQKYQNYYNDESLEKTVKELEADIIKVCSDNRTNKVVFSGGDPLFSKNRDEVIDLVSRLQTRGYYVCLYTGYSIEKVMDFYREKDGYVMTPQYFKCGTYREDLKRKTWGKKNDCISWVSSNQELYNYSFNKVSENGVFHF